MSDHQAQPRRRFTDQQRLIAKAVILSGGRVADVAEHVGCTDQQAVNLAHRMGYRFRGF
jgi:transposase-like protein